VFFADEVILVEGISDRIIIEAFIRGRGQEVSGAKTVEIVSVGGKGLFEPYAKLLNACRVRFSIIADLDYVEQVGNNNVKSLFRINESEIKSDVIDNLKSVDGATLVASIDKALAESSWEGAIEIWQYIKSRRRTLKPNLEESERATLRDFIRAKRVEKIFILEQGAIEDYLPDGMRSKDIDKLIRFLAEPEFWKKLPEDRRIEIDGILDEVLGPIS
jgi:predicted ATP-dependent endonuclease of OLD family